MHYVDIMLCECVLDGGVGGYEEGLAAAYVSEHASVAQSKSLYSFLYSSKMNRLLFHTGGRQGGPAVTEMLP